MTHLVANPVRWRSTGCATTRLIQRTGSTTARPNSASGSAAIARCGRRAPRTALALEATDGVWAGVDLPGEHATVEGARVARRQLAMVVTAMDHQSHTACAGLAIREAMHNAAFPGAGACVAESAQCLVPARGPAPTGSCGTASSQPCAVRPTRRPRRSSARAPTVAVQGSARPLPPTQETIYRLLRPPERKVPSRRPTPPTAGAPGLRSPIPPPTTKSPPWMRYSQRPAPRPRIDLRSSVHVGDAADRRSARRTRAHRLPRQYDRRDAVAQPRSGDSARRRSGVPGS